MSFQVQIRMWALPCIGLLCPESILQSNKSNILSVSTNIHSSRIGLTMNRHETYFWLLTQLLPHRELLMQSGV